MKGTVLSALVDARDRRIPAAVITDLADGAQSMVTGTRFDGDLPLSDAEREAVLDRLEQDASGVLDTDDDVRPLFVDVHAPPLRLAIIGAVHVAQHLVPMAAAVGFDLLVVDPRDAFATADRFPGVTLSHDWPDDALTAWGVDRRTAVVTLTHDPKFDDPALRVALHSPAFYIGALGSRRTHATRCDRLSADGVTPAALARLHAPIGLAIGAKSPAEIALSILSQIVAVRRNGAVLGATA